MNRSSLSMIICLGLLFPAQASFAQTPAAKPKASPKDAANKAKSEQKAEAAAEADRVARQRRANARALLISLASDARSFRDQSLRARTLSHIGDALWRSDPERGRELFRKAWEAAAAADQEAARKLEEEIRRQRAKTGGSSAWNSPPNLREEVLRLAAKRDRELGEEFLQNLKADERQKADGAGQRMSLAQELLASGDSERALQFAASELGNISISTVDFLSSLREKNAAAADQRFATLLTIAAGNPLADANTVSLLSSYLFHPHEYTMFHDGSISYAMTEDYTSPANVAPELRLAFFQVAQTILLRIEPAAQPEQSGGSIIDKYLVMKRLVPSFEQYAPKEMTESMRSRLEALGSMLSDRDRERSPYFATVVPEMTADREQVILDKIERAKTSAERDRLYLQLASGAMEKRDLRARDFVSKIDDTEFRNQARTYIDASLSSNAVQDKNIELALEMVQKGELTHIQRVWLLTRLAKLLIKTDRAKSSTLLDDAVSEARRIDKSDPDMPRALLAIANTQRLVEPDRTFDSVFEAVKAANSADGFTGEDGNLNIVFQTKGFSSARDVDEPDFDLKGIFDLLAREDYDRAVELAHGFQGEAPRASATIAIAQSVLNEKIAAVPASQPMTKR